MKAFTVEATIRFKDGREEPFKASFSAPIFEEERGYVCRFESSAFYGGSFHTPYPELSYSKAISHIRFFLDPDPWELLDERNGVIPLQAPLADEHGAPVFPTVAFEGEFHRPDGSQEPFRARIEAPVLNPEGLYGCFVSTSLYAINRSFYSDWPDHAYELAFRLVRQLASYQDGILLDTNGKPLVIGAFPQG